MLISTPPMRFYQCANYFFSKNFYTDFFSFQKKGILVGIPATHFFLIFKNALPKKVMKRVLIDTPWARFMLKVCGQCSLYFSVFQRGRRVSGWMDGNMPDICCHYRRRCESSFTRKLKIKINANAMKRSKHTLEHESESLRPNTNMTSTDLRVKTGGGEMNQQHLS